VKNGFVKKKKKTNEQTQTKPQTMLLEAVLLVACVLLLVQLGMLVLLQQPEQQPHHLLEAATAHFVVIAPRQHERAATNDAALPQRAAAPFRHDDQSTAGDNNDDDVSGLRVDCASNVTRLGSKIGRGNTKKVYVATDSRTGVTGVLKVPNADENVYALSDAAFARVFRTEASMLSRLKHRNVVQLLGACFDHERERVFTMVERLRPLPAVLRGDGEHQPQPLTAAERLQMARGVAELVRTWNHGTTALGVLVHCDFLPQQFGVSFDSLDVKLLDVEGLRPLPNNASAFFSDIRCDAVTTDAVCRRVGCFKGAGVALRFRDSFAGFDESELQEVRCNERLNRCYGMGIEYNVLAMCRFLFQDLLGPVADATALLRGCLDSRISQRWTIDAVITELERLALEHR
jgi:hypothetical protein